VESSSSNTDEEGGGNEEDRFYPKDSGVVKFEEEKQQDDPQNSYSAKKNFDKLGDSAKRLVRQMMDDTVRILGINRIKEEIAQSLLYDNSHLNKSENILQGI
jgi:hypothetical protein